MAERTEKPRFTAAPSSRVYDAIVLGGSLGAGFAAALLARRGLRVLWTEHDGTRAGYTSQGFLWPREVLPLPPIKAMPLLEDALTELGLTTQVTRALRPVVPALQLLLPRHRLDLPLDDARRLAECAREFGKQGARIARTFKELGTAHAPTDAFLRSPEAFPPSGFLARWRVARAVRATAALASPSPLSESEPAEQLLARAVPFLVYQEGAGPLAVRRSLGQLLAGPQRLPGGTGGLRDIVAHRFTELGGTLLAQESLSGRPAAQLAVEHGRPVGVDVRGSEASHRAPFLVSTLDTADLLEMLPESLRSAKGSAMETAAAAGAVLSVHWMVPEQVLPRGLGELLLADDGRPPAPLLLQVGPARRAEARADEPSLRLVTAAAVVPPDVEPDRIRGHAARIEEALERLLPFARARVVARSVPQLDAPRPRPGHLLHPLFPRSPAAWDGLGVPADTPWPTLIRAGREVCPGLGLEGEVLAALGAVARVQRASQKGKGRGK